MSLYISIKSIVEEDFEKFLYDIMVAIIFRSPPELRNSHK